MPCRTRLKGVQLVFCDDEGAQQQVWVDIKKVPAIAWCEEAFDGKDANKPPVQKAIPTDKKGPAQCPGKPSPGPRSDPPLCWWDGNDWVCGTE